MPDQNDVCPKCRKALPADSTFCSWCGEPLRSELVSKLSGAHKREIVDDLKRRKIGFNCPSCGSINVTISEAERKFLSRSNVVIFLVGLVMIAMAFLAERPDPEISSDVWGYALVGWVFLIVVVFAGGVFGLPIPILGNFLGRTFEIRLECSGCHHRWTRGFRTELSR